MTLREYGVVVAVTPKGSGYSGRGVAAPPSLRSGLGAAGGGGRDAGGHVHDVDGGEELELGVVVELEHGHPYLLGWCCFCCWRLPDSRNFHKCANLNSLATSFLPYQRSIPRQIEELMG